jgi:hypothetical protein
MDGHGKAFAEAILARQSQYFCIERVCCVISASDIRQILRPRPDIAQSLTAAEVAERWLRLCPSIRTTSVAPDPPTRAEILSITRSKTRVREIREQLSDVSWWMRLLCQRLAQYLNSRNGLSGPFHHGRFRSQKLLDDGATNETLSAINLAVLPLDTPEQITPKALRALAVKIALQTHSSTVSSASAQQTIAHAPQCEAVPDSNTPASARSAAVVRHSSGPAPRIPRCIHLPAAASFACTRPPPSIS